MKRFSWSKLTFLFATFLALLLVSAQFVLASAAQAKGSGS